MAGSSLKRTALLIVGVLAIEMAFVFSYVGGLGRPYPHGVPIAVVGSPAAQHLAIEKIRAAGTQFDVSAYPDRQSAVTAIEQHRLDGAIVLGSGTHDELIVAGAPSPAVASAIDTAVAEFEAGAGRTFATTTVVPLSVNDPEGLGPFYLVVGWVVGGYLVASLVALARGTEPSFRWALARLGALLAFSVASGVFGVLLASALMHLFPGNFWALAGLGTLVVFAVSAVTTAFQVLFGELGIALAIVVFVVVGNPSSGGPYPREFLGGVWRTVGAYLPNGAGLDGVRTIAYFGSNGLGSLLTLAVYSVVGTGAFLVARRCMQRTRPRGVPEPALRP